MDRRPKCREKTVFKNIHICVDGAFIYPPITDFFPANIILHFYFSTIPLSQSTQNDRKTCIGYVFYETWLLFLLILAKLIFPKLSSADVFAKFCANKQISFFSVFLFTVYSGTYSDSDCWEIKYKIWHFKRDPQHQWTANDSKTAWPCDYLKSVFCDLSVMT